MSMNERFDAFMRQHELMFGKGLVPLNCPNLAPISNKRCSKCQDIGLTSSDCSNKKFVTLEEREATMEEDNEKKNEDESDHELEETQEEVMEEAREEELLVPGRFPSHQKGVKDEPASPIHTHPIA